MSFVVVQVKKEVLLSSLESAGFVWELHIPTSPDGEVSKVA